MLYVYKAKDQKGLLREGEVEAENQQAAFSLLKKENLILLSISEKKVKKKNTFELFNRVSLRDLAIFTKELQVMIKGGLSIVATLKAQGEQLENKKLSQISFKLAQMVEGGVLLSEAMRKFPSAFSPLYINTIKSGERSGKLEEVLLSLADQLERDYELNSKIRGAMIYPIFILSALFAVVALLFIFVMPTLTKLFEELQLDLPITTRLLISISKFLIGYWWLIIIFCAAAVLALKFYGKTESGTRLFDKLKIRMPLFGPLLRKIYLARFCRTGSTLIKSGLPILEALKTTREVITNTIYQEEIEGIRKKVESGMALSAAMKETEHFPAMFYQLISVGEESGTIDESLDTLANFFEKDISATTAALASLIEPALIIVIGIGIAFVIISIVKPIYSLTESL